MIMVIKGCLLTMAVLAFLASAGEKEPKSKGIDAMLCVFFVISLLATVAISV